MITPPEDVANLSARELAERIQEASENAWLDAKPKRGVRATEILLNQYRASIESSLRRGRGAKKRRPISPVERILDAQSRIHAQVTTAFLEQLVQEDSDGPSHALVLDAIELLPEMSLFFRQLLSIASGITQWRERNLQSRSPIRSMSAMQDWLNTYDPSSMPSLPPDEFFRRQFRVAMQVPRHVVPVTSPAIVSKPDSEYPLLRVFSEQLPVDPELKALVELGSMLSQFGWHVFACNGFIIAGTPLRRELFEVELIPGILPGTNRMLIEVDPEVSPDELAKVYALARLEAGLTCPKNRKRIWEVEALDLTWRTHASIGSRSALFREQGPRDRHGRPVSKTQITSSLANRFLARMRGVAGPGWATTLGPVDFVTLLTEPDSERQAYATRATESFSETRPITRPPWTPHTVHSRNSCCSERLCLSVR